MLAYYFGGKQYAKDTADVINGKFTFQGKEKLKGGMYLIVLSEDKYLDIIRKHNVVSISVRQNRYSERMSNKFDQYSISKSQDFVDKTVHYIYQSIKFIKSKVHNPKFLLWSNDFTGLEKYFPTNEFLYVINPEDKILNDFYLLTQCKYFIVGPSTFSWWGAWLSNNESKICIRPKTINPSNNLDFWPESWISI